jgi:hypothetical protein
VARVRSWLEQGTWELVASMLSSSFPENQHPRLDEA